MRIPENWRCFPLTPAELETEIEAVSEAGAPDSWLRQSRVMVNRASPGDWFCKYYVEEGVSPDDRWDFDDYEGFALVRDDEVLDWIQVPQSIS